jgi:hypothetical protein
LETLIGARKEVGLEVNTEKTKYMLLSHHQNAGQNHDIKLANRGFEKIFWNDYNKSKPDSGGNKRRLHSGKACYHSVQNLLSYRLLSKTYELEYTTQ